MAKKVIAPTWTKVDVELAKKLRTYANDLKGSFLEKFGAAAQAHGYRSYSDLPSGVKSYISSLGGKRRSSQNLTPIIKRRGRATREHGYVDPQNAEYYEELRKSKTMQHGLHPEDEAVLVEHFSQLR